MFKKSFTQTYFKAESISKIKLLACCTTSKRYKGFAAAMAEALDNLAQLNKDKQKDTDELSDIKRFKTEMKRRKWVDYKLDDLTADESASKKANFDPSTRVKRRKTAILLGYSGANYYGMQRNPGMSTIEEELFKVMLKHKWITDDSFEQAQNACFQRAARTDKGVSAARQVCSAKLPEDLKIDALNADLPEQIRVFAVERVTKGFNAKDQCNARTYTYTLPSIAFGSCSNQYNLEDYRSGSETLNEVNAVLKLYEGTQNFHNFTSRKNFNDPSAKRYIMSFSCSEPFVSPGGIEFVTLKVKGQSFMLHQIRKMVGLTIAIVRGNTTRATIERAFTEERLDLPMAPGLGLVLDTVHYERYNNRYGTDGIHKPLTWLSQEEQINEFVEKYIYANIYETEQTEQSMVNWLQTLSLHSYEARKDDPATDTEKATKSNGDDDNEE